jgi:hypothetical protein
MSRTKYDQFSKEFLAGLLDPFGTTAIDVSVSSEVREIDLLFTPLAGTDPSRLGLLGRIAQTPCIIEPYRNPPDDEDIRICLMRLAIYEGGQRREARRQQTALPNEKIPLVWVVAPTLSPNFLEGFGAAARPDWPQGVYFLPERLRAVLVAVHQLPVVPETLWLRILGRGRVQGEAVRELLALPESLPERSQVLRLIKNWQIRVQQNQEPEEAEMAVQLSQAYLEWEQKTRLEGEQIGELRGRLEAARNFLRLGVAPEVVAQAVEMSLEEVQQLQQAQP